MTTSTIPAINSIPSISTPLVDQNGNMSATWHEYFRKFINSTVQVENTVTTVVTDVTPGAGLKLDPMSTASNVILDVSAGPGLVANASNLTMDIHDLNNVQATLQQEIMVSDPSNNNTVEKTTVSSLVGLASSPPAGPTTAVQVNIKGATYGDANFTYDGSSTVTINNNLYMNSNNNVIYAVGGNTSTLNYGFSGGTPIIRGGAGISLQLTSAAVTMALTSGVSCIWNPATPAMTLTGLNIVNTGNTVATTGLILTKVNATEASNAVTASGYSGVITTSSLTTAASGSYVITWTNTRIATTSVIHLTLMGGTNTTSNVTVKATAGSGTSTLTIINDNTLTALNGTILIGYIVV